MPLLDRLSYVQLYGVNRLLPPLVYA